jgi:hypothetical protein
MPALLVHTTRVRSSQRIPAPLSAPAQWRRWWLGVQAREAGVLANSSVPARPRRADVIAAASGDASDRDEDRQQQRAGDVEQLLAGGLQRVGDLQLSGSVHQHRPQRSHAGR